MSADARLVGTPTGCTGIDTDPCPLCGKTSRLIVRSEGFHQWIKGVFVQNAFPELSESDCELLITGTHAECWEAIFAEDA